MTNEERDRRVISRVRGGVLAGPVSTPEARRRVMDAVRAEAASPSRDVRRGWRSPAFGLLAAASIAGIIALVHTRGISYVPAPVPGVGPTATRSTATSAVPAHQVGIEPAVSAVRVQFVLVDPAAKQVSVVGDFNDWNPTANPLQSVGGVWSSVAVVTSGRHDYAFVVDGKWISDPAAPRAPADELSGGYSVLIAGAKP